jgi:hypothetical protein
LQGNEKEKMMTDTSGRKCLELFGNYARAGSWARTFSALLIGTGDWYSRRCKLTWKLKGTKYNRMYFQLAPSTLPTDATESGFWPTPNCAQRDRTEIAIKRREEGIPLYARRDKAGTARQFSIVDYAVYKGLLPTPTAMDSTGATANMKNTQVKEGSMHSVTLSRAMTMGLLPTPTSRDEKNGGKLEDGRIQRKIQQGWTIELNDLATIGALPMPDNMETQSQTGETSHKLNPQFVLEMMGFPLDWTELPFLSGETNP